MDAVLDASQAALFSRRPQLGALIQRIRQQVSLSDAQVDDLVGALDHARVALNSRRLILDAVENVADPLVVAEAAAGAPACDEGERPDPVPISEIIAQLHDLHCPLQKLLAASSIISDDLHAMQDRQAGQRAHLIRRRAAIHERLVVVYDSVTRALAHLDRLLVEQKLDRQRRFDDALVAVLGQRVVAFDLKLRAMRRRLEADTYRPGAVLALGRVRDRLRADLDRARAELDAARRRLGQYAGIAEFDALVAEYGAVRRQIAVQRQLIQQLSVQ